MSKKDLFFKALGIDADGAISAKDFARATDIPLKRLKYYNEFNIVPTGDDQAKLEANGISINYIRILLGHLTPELMETIRNSEDVRNIAKKIPTKPVKAKLPDKRFSTNLGTVYKSDCINFLENIESDSIDLIFADPPFNLDKLYPSQINDRLKHSEYLHWCSEWIDQCARVLTHGGSMFLWNLPKWNLCFADQLNSLLTFKHNISVDIKYSLPIAGRLYPSNYSLLYYVKGSKANTFKPDRLPMPICPHCYGDLRDYGGYKSKMNPLGISLSDVWTDISPVRHRKYKARQGSNELPLRLMDRVIELSTNEGDTVLDPFGGSGTTYIVSEIKNRKWVGSEIGPLDHIVERFKNIEAERNHLASIRSSINSLFNEKHTVEREKKGLWTSESVRGVKRKLGNL